MKSDMVPDVSLVEEVLAGHDDDDTSVEIDFAEGLSQFLAIYFGFYFMDVQNITVTDVWPFAN